MRTLEERLTELSDSLLERTIPIDANDCVQAASSTLEDAPEGKRRRAAVAVAAAVVVLTGTGFTFFVTRDKRTDVRIVTTVPTSGPVTTTPPTSAPTASEFIGALPDCVPVDDTLGETVGCVIKSQLIGGEPGHEFPPGMPGLPVYDRAGGVIVGYELPLLGFIPRSITDDPAAFAHTTRCLNLLDSGALDGSPELAGCSDAIKAYGFPDPAKTAHQMAEQCASYGPNPPQPCRKP